MSTEIALDDLFDEYHANRRLSATVLTGVDGSHVAVVPLANDRGKALVDAEDLGLVLARSWQLHSGGYAQSCAGGKTILMHRRILAAPAQVQVDHVNGNRLDNRRSNLRLATQSQQNMNRRRGATRSGFKGVVWFEPRSCWAARINRDGKRRYLGYFKAAEDAARAYDAAARDLFGEFARLNFAEASVTTATRELKTA